MAQLEGVMTGDITEFSIRFENLSVAEANILASELKAEIIAADDRAQAAVVKDDPTTQDFGATLILVLGTPAIVVVARAIADYIQRRGVSVSITPDGGVSISNVRSADVADIVKNLPKKK
jgi:hypothetical protein